ncbi:MAG: GreA/GreB family elongation factor [Verrucomicrobiales bacterium]|nr:GreA/GreB family elongation factor [Verrucomicrobiales bacterium]
MSNAKENTELLPIYITHQDKQRLENMIALYKREKNQTDDLTAFSAELERATAVESHHILHDVVRMNSRVTIVDLNTHEELTFTLVFPEDADPDNNKISVFAPIGAGILGYQTDDEIDWVVPAGTRRFRIAEVIYEPEGS